MATTSKPVMRSVNTSLREPTKIGSLFKNRRGDVIIVQLKEYQGFIFCNIRQFFQDKTGISRPTKKGIAIGLRKLDDLADLINKAIAKAHELGLLNNEGRP